MKSQQFNYSSLGTRNARNDMIALGSPNVALWVLGKGYLVPATSSPLAFGESDVQLQGNQGAKALRPRPSWTVANMNPWYQKLGGVSEVPLLCFAFQNKNSNHMGRGWKPSPYHLFKTTGKKPELKSTDHISKPIMPCHRNTQPGNSTASGGWTFRVFRP